MDTRTIRVVVETRDAKIVGDLTLPREGYRSRLSDYLNHSHGGFIPLANATIFASHPDAGGATEQHEFVAIGSRHVVLAYDAPDVSGGGVYVQRYEPAPSPALFGESATTLMSAQPEAGLGRVANDVLA